MHILIVQVAESCQFERLDQTFIMKEHNELEREAIKAGIVRIQGKSLKEPNAALSFCDPCSA